MINGCLNWQHSTLDCVSRGCFPRSFDGCYRAAVPSTHRTNFLNFFQKMRPSRIVVNIINITTNDFSASKINGIFLKRICLKNNSLGVKLLFLSFFDNYEF